MTRAAGLLTVAFALAAAGADAKTWTVGGRDADFPLISPAVAAASAGDVIIVRAGVYRENLAIDKPLSLVGQGNPTLFGTGVGSVVTIDAPGCLVSGFTIEMSGAGESNEMDAAVQIRSNGNRVAGNVMRRVFYGVVVAGAGQNEIVDNDIEGLRDLPYGKRGDGVYLFRAPGTFVARNRVSAERDAIYFQYAPGGQALDNVVTDSRYALHDMFSDDARIARNTLSNSMVGANIMNSRRIRVEANRIAGNRGVPGVGLTLKDCDDSTVTGNTIAGNSRGLLIDGSSTNRFTGNRFRGNDTGVVLFSSAESNTFAANEFIDNWGDVVLSGRDSGTKWSGNYWSRYRGFDFDGDGVGDAPHPILGAFERIEGANPSARLFLHSPAAAGLEFAAHLAGPGYGAAGDGVDRHPIVRRTSEAGTGRNLRHPAAGGAILAGLAALAFTTFRGASPCSS